MFALSCVFYFFCLEVNLPEILPIAAEKLHGLVSFLRFGSSVSCAVLFGLRHYVVERRRGYADSSLPNSFEYRRYRYDDPRDSGGFAKWLAKISALSVEN